MIELTKPDLILTHESDLDGLVSGLLLQRLAQHCFGAAPRLQAYHYQNWRNREMRESCAWVADFALDERMDKPGWLILDHHPLELEPRHARLIHDLSKSAALLTYELCCEHGLGSPALERLVRLTNVTDLFLEDDPDFTLANDYANLVKSYQFWNLHALIGGQLEKLLDHPLLQVMEVKRRVEDPLGLAWSRDNITELSSTVGLVETVVGNNNLIVHELLETKATPYTVLVTLFRKANGPVIVSLRSRNGEAVQVAGKLQGGGHPNASGAVLPRSVRTTQDAAQYLKDVLNPSSSDRKTSLNSLEEAFAALDLEKK
jgi:oligoribonuclease NrnB/cAMP/cGMP phosphodiesterase (DHH superfamily)